VFIVVDQSYSFGVYGSKSSVETGLYAFYTTKLEDIYIANTREEAAYFCHKANENLEGLYMSSSRKDADEFLQELKIENPLFRDKGVRICKFPRELTEEALYFGLSKQR
jgi:hypothetical protein